MHTHGTRNTAKEISIKKFETKKIYAQVMPEHMKFTHDGTH
jgi:hypothetical protein